VDINRAWETIRENIKMSAKKSLGYSFEVVITIAKLKKYKLPGSGQIPELIQAGG
jgi:hypothetical protein